MLSNHHRWTKVLLLSALLSALCLGNYLATPARLERDIQERFEVPGGQEAPLQVGFARVERTRQDGTFHVLLPGRGEVDVAYEGEAWNEGDVVSFSGWVTPEGRIRVTSFTVHRDRQCKKILSLLAALVFACALTVRVYERKVRKGGACRT